MMSYSWRHVTAPKSHDIISMASCYITPESHDINASLQRIPVNDIINKRTHQRPMFAHESCFTQNGGESLYTMHALLWQWQVLSYHRQRIVFTCSVGFHMYVDSRVSVGVHDGARALGTDFSTYLLIHGLDKLVFSCFCFVFKANRTPSGKKTVTWMQVNKSAFPSLSK